jgi:hypothetical protein
MQIIERLIDFGEHYGPLTAATLRVWMRRDTPPGLASPRRASPTADRQRAALYNRARREVRGAVFGRTILAAMPAISARKARHTADNSCLAREMTATCHRCIGESSGKKAIEGGV